MSHGAPRIALVSAVLIAIVGGAVFLLSARFSFTVVAHPRFEHPSTGNERDLPTKDTLPASVEQSQANDTADVPPTEAAVVYLVPPNKLGEYGTSLAQLCLNFPFGSNYDLVLVGYDTDPSETLKTALTMAMETAKPCNFRNIFNYTVDPTEGFMHETWVGAGAAGDNYKKMIWFYLHGILTLEPFSRYRYIMRMDTDSILLSPMQDDPAKVMRENDAVIGYNCFTYEAGYSEGLADFVRAFLSVKPARYPGFMIPDYPSQTVPQFYVNFNMLDRWALSRNPEVLLFIRTALPGIIRYRWGDTPLWALIAGLFYTDKDVVHLNKFGYQHGRGNRFITLPGNQETIEWNITRWSEGWGNINYLGGHCWDKRIPQSCILTTVGNVMDPNCPQPLIVI